MSDIFGNSSSANLNDVVITDSTTNGSFTITTLNNETYNLQTPDNGDNLDVLTTDGVGNTYWAPSGGGGGTPTFQDVYNASSTPTDINILATKPINFLGPTGQTALKILSSVGGFTRVEGNSARFEFMATNSLEPLTNEYINILGESAVITDRTIFTEDQEFITKKYVDNAISANNQDFQSVYDASATPANITLVYGKNIKFETEDSDNILSINANTSTDYGISAERVYINELNSTTSKSGSFIKNGGTSQQYLMADGSSLQFSQNSGNSNFYLYDNSDNITTPPPTNGHIGYNNAIQANATILYISHLTSDGIDVDIFFTQLTQLQDVYIQDKSLSTNFIKYNITGTPTIIPNSYISIPVLYTATILPAQPNGAGTGLTSFGNNHPLIISFFTNSIEVDLRLTTLETKTQHQTASANTTTFASNLNTNTILAATDNTYDLGFIGNQFRRGYFATALRSPVYDTSSSTLLEIAPSNANAINIGRVGITSTILGTTNINSVYTLPNTAPSVGDVLTCSALGVSNWINPILTTSQSSFSNYQLNFSQTGTLTSQNGFLPTAALVPIGGTTIAIATTNTSTRTKIFKCQNPTLSVADGQRSGYSSSLTANTWPIVFGRTGMILNIASGIGDTNITINAITQMFQGFTNVSVVPSFSSALGPNTTPSIIGWGHDVGDSVISFYFRGTASGAKIATPFSTATPSPYWFNFNIFNACNSDLFTLTLTDIISGLTATQNFTMAIGNTAVMSPQDRLFFLSCRGMGVVGGITNSAISQFSKFGLSLK